MPRQTYCLFVTSILQWSLLVSTTTLTGTTMAFQVGQVISPSWTTRSSTSSTFTTVLDAKASKKKKKKGSGGGGTAAGIKGFGASSSSSKGGDTNTGSMDRSAEAMAFYKLLEDNGASDNLKRVAIGMFPLPGGNKLRGIMALKDMKKGDVIIRVPYEMAVNLGAEGEDPTIPAVQLLRRYCNVLNNNDKDYKEENDSGIDRTTYYKMLPEYKGDDCLGSTDFFSNEALDALQSPLVVEETLKRRERTKNRFQMDVASDESFPKWIDGTTDLTDEHLQWAVWLITSRVLTVQGDVDEGRSYRLLIPLLDMCNHDRSSVHVLTGRAVPGGELKVVAGGPIKAGEQINICYGGGVAGNDRFVQDYGFLDHEEAYKIVAMQLYGKQRILEGVGKGRTMIVTDREKTMEALESTTVQEDEEALSSEKDPSIRSAIEYRIGVKKALEKYA
mmetsp:Transcript_16728/g.23607  ORF Transcript_16728/g.23607 Transcript_16728/m.23607 type:complete len:445 (+) Transcript_16728:303-1637(+)